MSENCSGVYSITNTLNGHVYIGSAVNISRRWSQHTLLLNRNCHHSGHLQNAWNKYGSDNFEFTVLEYCEIDYLTRCEQFYIDSEYPAYNMSPTAGSNLGIKFSVEARANMSEAHLGKSGRKHTEATRLKISEAHKGMHPSVEARANMSEVQKGNTNSLGYTHTDAARANMSLAAMGRTVTDATRAQISAAMTGTHPSAEAVLNMCAAQQRSWAKRR